MLFRLFVIVYIALLVAVPHALAVTKDTTHTASNAPQTTNTSPTEKVRIAVASNFKHTLEKIALLFTRKQKNVQVRVSSAASGALFAYILNGAPFDIFLSADSVFPRRLEQRGIALANTRVRYAEGQLVLLFARHVEKLATPFAPPLLLRPEVKHIAIANHHLAPYGRATLETLHALGIQHAVQSKIITGNNIGQVNHFIASGNAQAGFVSMAQILQQEKLPPHWPVAPGLHSPLQQEMVRLTKRPIAVAFWEFMRSDEVRSVIYSSGYR